MTFFLSKTHKSVNGEKKLLLSKNLSLYTLIKVRGEVGGVVVVVVGVPN